MMPGNHPQWAAQMTTYGWYSAAKYFIGQQEYKVNKYNVSIYARAEGDADTGTAIRFGIFSLNKGKELACLEIPLNEAKGSNYKRFSFPTMELGQNLLFYITPPNRPLDEVSRIFIDKITIVREDE